MTVGIDLVALRRRRRIRLCLAAVALIVVMLTGCLAGPVAIPIRTVGQVAWVSVRSLFDSTPADGEAGVGQSSGDWPQAHETILLRVRFPRVVQGALVGMGLGVAGASLQGLFRNPMADPYVLGLSSGAALGAAVSIVTGVSVSAFGLGATPLFAFIGAIGSMFLVYNLARSQNRVPVITLLLAGVAVGTVLSSVVTLLMVIAHEKLDRIVFWLMGGLAGARWPVIIATVPYLLSGSLVLLLRARDLNLLATGEETAQSLGLSVENSKRLILACASLVTAAAVCASGTIAFVGLIVPHIARLLLGADYRVLLPGSALIGASLLVGADVVARLAVAPSELPVGVVTAMLGGPFFLWLLRRNRNSGWGGD